MHSAANSWYAVTVPHSILMHDTLPCCLSTQFFLFTLNLQIAKLCKYLILLCTILAFLISKEQIPKEKGRNFPLAKSLGLAL